MWGQAIDTAVGMTFLFAVTALFCSALVEGYATMAERRAKYLITALRNMLDAPESSARGGAPAPEPDAIHAAVKRAPASGTPAPAATTPAQQVVAALRVHGCLTAMVFDHPLIRALQTRKVRPGFDGQIRNPQYIPSSVFAQALVATLSPARAGAALRTGSEVLKDLRGVLEDPELAHLSGTRSLLALLDQSRGDLDTFVRSVEGWFEAEMERISGWYKRWARAVLLVVGLGVAILANIDTVSVGHTLWVDAPVRSAVVAEATSGTLCRAVTDPQQRQACAEKEIGQLAAAGLPIGPLPGCGISNLGACLGSSVTVNNGFAALLLKLVGWLVTGIAVSFGAPFWFDALSKLGNLRSSGPRPSGSTT